MYQGSHPTALPLTGTTGGFYNVSQGHEVTNGDSFPDGSFERAVIQRDYVLVKSMLENSILEEEWGIHLAVDSKDDRMLVLLLEHGIFPIDDDVDHCIMRHDLETAIMFTQRFDCAPTRDAFGLLFQEGDADMDAHDYIRVLEWLYYTEHAEMDVDVVRSICNTKGMDPIVIKWFEERAE